MTEFEKELVRFVSGYLDAGVSAEDYVKAFSQRLLDSIGRQSKEQPVEVHPLFRVGDYVRNKTTKDKVLIEQLDMENKTYLYFSWDGAAEVHSDFSFSRQDEWELIGQTVPDKQPVCEGLHDAAVAHADRQSWDMKEWEDLKDRDECINDFIAGAKWQKEQMMKNALHGWLDEDNEPPYDLNVLCEEKIPFGKFKHGDKVKLIIVKEEGK